MISCAGIGRTSSSRPQASSNHTIPGSQTYVDQVTRHIQKQNRQSVLIYAGDFDPSGTDIDRDFLERTGGFDKSVRVALNQEQIAEYDLPPMVGKSTDSRANRFVEKYGSLIQVEVDALPPDVLRDLYRTAIDQFWNEEAYRTVREVEDREREEL